MNCLKAGHMANKCRSPQSCRKYRKTHHTLLHIERAEPAKDSTTETVSSVTCVPQLKRSKQVLLMTCKAKIYDGTFTQARVFLDPGAFCSFVTERLAQQLRLPRHKDNTMIAGIAGVNAMHSHGTVSFTLGHACGGGKRIRVQNPFVLTRVTADMPVNPVGPVDKWKPLAGLDLADPDFGTPARVDIFLGADYYGEILICSRRWGPRGTPYAQKPVLDGFWQVRSHQRLPN